MGLHTFQLKAQWRGALDGEGKIAVKGFESNYSAATELGGAGKGTSPEELLLAAAAGCYLLTLSIILAKKKLPVLGLALRSEGVVEGSGSELKFSRMVHEPTILLSVSATREEQQSALETAVVAEKFCLISRAMAGNVEVRVRPLLSVG